MEPTCYEAHEELPLRHSQHSHHTVGELIRFLRRLRDEPRPRARLRRRQPNARLRDIAATVGITERTAGQIVSDLEQAGYLSKSRDGRRNQYTIDDDNKLRHPRLTDLASNQVIALLLDVFDRPPLI